MSAQYDPNELLLPSLLGMDVYHRDLVGGLSSLVDGLAYIDGSEKGPIDKKRTDIGLSIAKAAEGLGITRQQLYNNINGKSAITPEMAVRLEKGIGSTADTWLRMQTAFDLAEVNARRTSIKVKKLSSKAA